jgi:hypothetical protein
MSAGRVRIVRGFSPDAPHISLNAVGDQPSQQGMSKFRSQRAKAQYTPMHHDLQAGVSPTFDVAVRSRRREPRHTTRS